MEFKVIKRNGNAVVPDGMFKLCGMEDVKLISMVQLNGGILLMLIPPDVTPQRQSYTYANEADVLNVALFGITAKEWRQTHPDSKGNIRDEASLQQLIVLANLESINAELIRQGVPQGERLFRLNVSAKQMMQSLVGDHRIDELRPYGELPKKENK